MADAVRLHPGVVASS